MSRRDESGPQAPDPADTAPSGGRRSVRRALLFGLLGALIWGGWALRVNAGAGASRAARAALAQAALSFSATMGMSLVLERLFRLGRTPWRGFWIAALGASSISACGMATVHALAGTPRIIATAGPSVALGATFFTVYAWGLRVAAVRRLASGTQANSTGRALRERTTQDGSDE